MAFVDSGQVVGIGVGYVIAGFAIAVLSWRWAFWLLGLPAVVAAVLLWRKEDPPRGGAEHHEDAETGAEAGPHVEPDPALVLDDPEGLSIWEAARYVLRVRTNVVVVLAGSVGQFFFAGLSTFAVVYVTGQYRISTAQADLGLPVLGAGALAGMFGGAWLGDRLQRRGQPDARLIVGGVSFFVATGFALPAILTHSLLVAVPAIVAGTAALNAATPTLDAVRLSVIVPPLRGRAEAVRTVVRTGAEGFAPLAFGLLADSLAGGGHSGLRLAFLITLPAVAANGLLTLLARRWYQREVASARASGTQPAP
jgi:MFS family permease